MKCPLCGNEIVEGEDIVTYSKAVRLGGEIGVANAGSDVRYIHLRHLVSFAFAGLR